MIASLWYHVIYFFVLTEINGSFSRKFHVHFSIVIHKWCYTICFQEDSHNICDYVFFSWSWPSFGIIIFSYKFIKKIISNLLGPEIEPASVLAGRFLTISSSWEALSRVYMCVYIHMRVCVFTKLLSCVWFSCNPMDCCLPGLSIHDIFFQSRMLGWIALPPAWDLCDPVMKPTSPVSPALAGGFFTTMPPGKP